MECLELGRRGVFNGKQAVDNQEEHLALRSGRGVCKAEEEHTQLDSVPCVDFVRVLDSLSHHHCSGLELVRIQARDYDYCCCCSYREESSAYPLGVVLHGTMNVGGGHEAGIGRELVE